jgi:lipoic acid synthetase
MSEKERAQAKLARIPVKVVQEAGPALAKPAWLKVTLGKQDKVDALKQLLRSHKLHTVCEEAACPNLPECFAKGTATFMIMGDRCTRRCAFCDVAHGRPLPLDPEEPANLAKALQHMGLRYIVITSVDRDDLLDGGASHFAACIQEIREKLPAITIEILVPDFRGRLALALEHLSVALPDVLNHNIETVPRLYKAMRLGSDYQGSLDLLKEFKARHPKIPTKSGIMLGLGETDEEVHQVLRDLRAHDCDLLTIGQYLQPSSYHAPVLRYVTPEQFTAWGQLARELGFRNVASGPLVRSSYHADLQLEGREVK